MREQFVLARTKLEAAERSFIKSGILVAVCGAALESFGLCRMRGVIFAVLFGICNLRSWKLFVQGLAGSSLANISNDLGDTLQAAELVKSCRADIIGGILTKIAALTIIVIFFVTAESGEVESFLLGFLLFLILGLCFYYPDLSRLEGSRGSKEH